MAIDFAIFKFESGVDLVANNSVSRFEWIGGLPLSNASVVSSQYVVEVYLKFTITFLDQHPPHILCVFTFNVSENGIRKFNFVVVQRNHGFGIKTLKGTVEFFYDLSFAQKRVTKISIKSTIDIKVLLQFPKGVVDGNQPMMLLMSAYGM